MFVFGVRNLCLTIIAPAASTISVSMIGQSGGQFGPMRLRASASWLAASILGTMINAGGGAASEDSDDPAALPGVRCHVYFWKSEKMYSSADSSCNRR